jgi:hypothetical protein
VVSLLDDPAEAGRLGAAGRQYAHDHLLRDHILGKFLFWLREYAVVEPAPERMAERMPEHWSGSAAPSSAPAPSSLRARGKMSGR